MSHTSKISLATISILALLALGGCSQKEALNQSSVSTKSSVQANSKAHKPKSKEGTFTIPTEYSKTLISRYSIKSFDDEEKWQKVAADPASESSNQIEITYADMDACQELAVNHVLIPFLNTKGVAVESMNDLMQMSMEESTVIEELVVSEAQVEIDANIYLINCMVDKGYRFKE